jgi:vancomycin permeability regulator SanA
MDYSTVQQRVMLWMRRHAKGLLALGAIVALSPVLVILLCALVIAPNGRHVLDMREPADIAKKNIRVGIVLGAGVNGKGKPYRELQARLDVAADAVQKGYVDKLILSGDNRFHSYNEPAAMMQYLLDVRHIPAVKLQPDYAGRSTYESCERAAKIFVLQKTIIFSAGSHLPRAIFLCRHFGVEAYGISSNVEARGSWRRELLAGVKAVYNAYGRGEPTVLGDKIRF